MCVRVCEREREREEGSGREREKKRQHVCESLFLSDYRHTQRRERRGKWREGGREREGEREDTFMFTTETDFFLLQDA